MRLPVLVRKQLRDLWQRKASVVALATIIAIGVSVYVGMSAVYRDLDGARERYYRTQRLSHFSVDLRRLPRSVVSEARAHDNIAALRGRISLPVRIELDGLPEPISGTALSMPADRRPVLDDCVQMTGRWFSGPRAREVILNHAFARENRLTPGDTIRVTLLDRQHRMLVVGTAMSPEFVYLIGGSGLVPDPGRFGVIYLPEEALAESADLEGAWNQLVGWAHDIDEGAIDRTLEDLERQLDRYGVTTTTPWTSRPSVRFLADELTGLAVQSRVMPAIFLAVAALVLNLLVSRMVAQQRTTLGVLRALGRSRTNIVTHVLSTGAAIGILGAVGGLLLGRWTQVQMLAMYAQFYEIPGIRPHAYTDIILIGAGIAVAAALVGTYSGARQAAALVPAEAMRPPPPERGGRVFLEYLPSVWYRIPFMTRVAVRSIFRNPLRSITSILATAVATSLITAMLHQVASLDEMFDYTFAVLSRQDVTVVLRDPVDVQAHSELARLPTLVGVEPQLSVPGELIGPGGRKRVGVVGLVPDAELFVPRDELGDPIPIPDRGLVLARKLGEMIGASPGDDVVLRPLRGRRTTVTVPVVAVVDTYMGLGAYANLDYLARLIGERPTGNAYLARTTPGAGRDALLAETVRRPGVIGVEERQRAFDQIEATIGETLGGFIAVIVLFSGMIGFGSVLNATLVSLSERQREVATYRCIGYTTGQVCRMFSQELLTLGAIGILFGLAGGLGLNYMLTRIINTELIRLPFVIVPWRMAAAAAAMAFFLGLSQLVVYRLIDRLEWLEALAAKE